MNDRKLTKVKLFFDESDPQNEGYAYRAYYSDGHQESDSYDEISTLLASAISKVLYHCEKIAEDLGGTDGETNFSHEETCATWIAR